MGLKEMKIYLIIRAELGEPCDSFNTLASVGSEDNPQSIKDGEKEHLSLETLLHL